MSKKPKTYPAVAWCDFDEDLLDEVPTVIDRITGDDAQEDNTVRAQFAALAVKTFGDRVAPGEDIETLIGDLLANLMHLCDAAGISFYILLERGRMHYDAELRDEP
jgi:hypothetical protein